MTNRPSIRDTSVLIVGAGPTGLVLALWLTRLGVPIRIIDKATEPGTTSRALAVQARTLEFYRQVGLADALVERARKAIAVNLWVTGKKAARAVFGDLGANISPFPYLLIFPQDEHERLLTNRLSELGVEVERPTELLSFEEAEDHVLARLRHTGGMEETCKAVWIAGCDGAHSAVREALKIDFPGGEYEHLFYVADVQASGEAINGEVHVGLDTSEFLAVFPLKAEGHARLVGTVLREAGKRHDDLSWPALSWPALSWNDVGKRVIAWMDIHVDNVNWFSTYRVHHRVVDRFRRGRAFLLGDAAHIHSPVGGQGMNTGIGEAVNLSWKLAAVLQGRANISLLDSYEPERIAFARRLLATTDRAFTGVTSSGAIARLVRLKIAPLLIPLVFPFAVARRFLFRTVSQTAIDYRGSSLSEGRAGTVHGGDRLPWVKDASDTREDNFTPLTSLDWQVHVYGAAGSELQSVCADRKLPLHVFPWRPEISRTGLRRDAVYLVRPDGYVALAVPDGNAGAVASYIDARNIRPR